MSAAAITTAIMVSRLRHQREQQPNVTVIYPPAAPPVIINQYGTDGQS